MSNVGFHRADPEWITDGSLLAQDVVKSCGLDRVADSRSSAMGFDKTAGIRIQAKVGVDLSHKIL